MACVVTCPKVAALTLVLASAAYHGVLRFVLHLHDECSLSMLAIDEQQHVCFYVAASLAAMPVLLQ